MSLIIPRENILNTSITCLTFEEQMMLMLKWAKIRESRTVCLANVHMIMEAYWDWQFAKVLNQADMVTPDGMPLVWMLRRLGIYNQNQVAGMEVFINLCELAQQSQISVYFLGSDSKTLATMKSKVEEEYPILQIAGMEALPYLEIEDIVAKQDEGLIKRINQSGAGLVFVCLGCPKQEIWMAQYQGKVNAVMVGVGAVFSMYAGFNPRAPRYLQRIGLEWLYRLVQEPRRLWNRYSKTIPPFIYLAIKQLLIPYKQKVKNIRQKLSDDNLMLNVENIDNSPNQIGEILVQQGLITQQQLQLALLEQKQFPDLKLGKILVRSNYVSLNQLKYYLRNQNIKIGEILIEKKLVKQQQLNKIIKLQKQNSQKLGELLLQKKLVSQKQLQSSLLEQYWRRKGWWLSQNRDINNLFKDKITI